MPQTVFTEMGVRKIKPPEKGQKDYFEKLNRGLTLMLRLSYGGTKAWRAVTYTKGKPTVRTLGRFPDMSVAAAKKAAFAFDPKKAKAAAEAGSFREVAEQWLKHYVDNKGLRSKREIVRKLKTYIYPEWGQTPIFEIRRKTVNALLDKIADKGKSKNPSKRKPMADSVLATVRSIMGWYATRDEDYSSPIVKGMNRDRREGDEKARKRILSDQEIREVWRVASDTGSFGAIVKLLLLTGQRREKVASMEWSDIVDGVWTVATEVREKGNAGVLRLPSVAVEILSAQAEVVGNPYVFPGGERRRKTGERPADRSPLYFDGWGKSKARLDAKLPADMPHWTIHDLRRTARSLMSRAGVPRDHAERVLGHRIGGVEGTYDRHAYENEKAEALDKLAKLIDQIINPPDATNVVAFPAVAGVEAAASAS